MDSSLRKKLLIALWIGIFVVGFGASLLGIGRESFWYDEAYTGSMMRQSVGGVVATIAGDTHPPLYFVALKLYSLLVGTGEGALRSFSALGLLALASLGFFAVRRIAGNGAGVLFAVLAFMLPINHQMAQEARNYTWTAFLTAGAMLYGLLAIREDRRGDWIRFGLFALAACYTHNYGLFTVFVTFCVLIVYCLVVDRKKALNFVLIGAGVAVLFLPWLFVLLKQAAKVGADYWIPEVTSDTLWSAVFYPYGYKGGGFGLPDYSTYAVFLMVIAIGAGIFYALKMRTIKLSLILIPLATWLLMLAFSYVVSSVFRPVFVLRYAMAFCPLFVLALAFSLAGFRQLPFAAAVLAILALFAGPQLVAQHQWQFNTQMREIRQKMLADNPPEVMQDAAFVCNNEHAFGCFAYYFPDNPLFLVLDDEVFKGYGNYKAFEPNGETGPDFSRFIEGKQTVFVVDFNPDFMPKVPWYYGAQGTDWRAVSTFRLPERFEFRAEMMNEDFEMPKINFFFSFRVERFDRVAAAR